MALTTCPDCSREISTAAPACPNCGRPTSSPVLAPPQPPQATKEETLWHGSPSWLLLLGKIIKLALVAILMPLALYYGYDWLVPHSATLQAKHDVIFRWGWLIIAAVLLWRIVVVLIAYARIRTTMYTVTNQRVIIETGIVEKKVEDIDLRYIDDTQFRQRIIERMLGIGNVSIISSDKVAPNYILRGIPGPRSLRELIRTNAYQVSQRQLFTRAT